MVLGACFLSAHKSEETNLGGQVSVPPTGNKLRRLMMFAWPCLLVKNCVDPATRYHGHLLLSHIIAKFAIHKRIVLQGE
jgi:transformation/transcription domain-associated protein